MRNTLGRRCGMNAAKSEFTVSSVYGTIKRIAGKMKGDFPWIIHKNN